MNTLLTVRAQAVFFEGKVNVVTNYGPGTGDGRDATIGSQKGSASSDTTTWSCNSNPNPAVHNGLRLTYTNP